MSISDIQKKKFLDNIYRLLYSNGNYDEVNSIRQPDENEVKREFDNYFTSNRIGAPLAIDINQLRNVEVTNPDLMNQAMARGLLNLEVLYDSIDDSSDKIMNVVTALDRRLKSLKDKRIELEKKVDNILFSISNTDGYFYSYGETFTNISNVDLSLSTAFVDTENRKATLPKLKSSVFDFNAPGKVQFANVKYSIYFNGNVISENTPVPDFNNMFDGLTNTKSTIEYSSNVIGACAVVITIPLNTPFVVSKVDGRLSTSSAVVTVAELIGTISATDSQFRRKQSNSDYDRFSFDFVPQNSGMLRLTLIKYEPDYVDAMAPNNKYKYVFSIRDLLVSGQYYDKNATLVSSPLSIPLGDDNKIIDAVSLEASNQNPDVGRINFFVAEDVPGATNISDFNWIPISSSLDISPSSQQIISFNKSTKSFKYIKANPNYNDIQLYPISTDENLSLKNPTTSIYNGVSVYRIGVVPQEDTPYNSYLLDSVNNFSLKYISYTEGLYKDTTRWSEIINGSANNVQIFEPGNIQITNTPSIPVALNLSNISGYIQTSLMVENETAISTTISKSGSAVDWDVAVYLNGTMIADIPSGLPAKAVAWNFQTGLNNIIILFDAEGSSSGTISLISGESITRYGTPFLKYYSYVDPFDFKVNRSVEDKVFTIDTYLGNKEILCRDKIGDNSRFVYSNNDSSRIDAIRVRADFSRFNNPFGTPSLNGYRLKFKNSM